MKGFVAVAALATLTSVTACRGQSSPSRATASTLIKAARILDVEAGVYRLNSAVLVSDGRIVQTGLLSEIQPGPAGTVTIDLEDVTLLPGLIDTHAHVLFSGDPSLDPGANIIAAITQVGLAGRVQIGASNAKELLEAGFTTVRNLGHSGINGDITLRDQIDRGLVPGPRILAAGRKITPPAGQGVTRLTADDAILRQEFIPVRGTADAERAVADLVAAGVDVIKIVADDDSRLMSRDEITAIVRAAHGARRRVAVHATTAPGIQAAIDGGVDSIEHGNEATDAMLKEMHDKGISLVPVSYGIEVLRDLYIAGRPMSDTEKAAAEKDILTFTTDLAGLVQRAMKAGVTIAAGSDMWMRYPGKTRGQATKSMLGALARDGMPPAAVIRAATADAAKVLGWSDRIGSLETGHFADMIAVQGDPLADIAALDAVTFVMKGGMVVTAPTR